MKKGILLLILALFLTGCSSWSDVQEEYADVLRAEPSCVYYPDENGQSWYEVSSIKLSADYNGAYFTYDSTKVVLIDNNDKYVSYIEAPSGVSFNVSQGFLQDLLEFYQDNNKCPENIYVERSYGYFQTTSCEGVTYCDVFSLKKSQVTNSEGTLKDCHHSSAVNDCLKTNVNNRYYLEFGYYKKSDNSVGTYFMVALNANYESGEISEDQSYYYVYKNLDSFVITGDAIAEIWKGNGKLIDESDLVIRSDYNGSGSTYYITGPNSDNYGQSYSEYEHEEMPDLDSDSHIDSAPLPELPVEDVDICTNNNTLKIFQVIGKIIFIIKILVPIILIVMGSIDFAKASLSGDDKAISQAAVTLGKRILTGLIIFFIPTVLDFFLSLVSGVSDTMGKYEACTNCVLNPNNESKCSVNPINS